MEKEKLTKLVKTVQKGNEAAIAELYNSYHNDLYYYILKVLDSRNDPDLAADLTQDAFIEILQTIDKLQDPEAFTTWSRKIAYHRCTAYFRKRHELLVDELEDGSTIFDTMVEEREEFIPGEALDKEALKNTIREMIASLPEEQRSAIMMRYFDELTVQEIASIQSTTEGTVKSRLNYGRKAIKKAVEDYEKKHDIKLHCAGIVPLLLWFFQAQKRANTAAQLSSLGATTNSTTGTVVKSATPKAVKKATTVTKNVAKLTARKVIAVALAGAVSAGVLGAGFSHLTKKGAPDMPNNHAQSSPAYIADSDSSPAQVSDITPEDFCGTWISDGNRLEIYYQEITERYYFEYYPADSEYFHFFADFDPQTGVFGTPENPFCGFVVSTSPDGAPQMDWLETNNPAWTFSCQDDILYWQTDENTSLTFYRDGATDSGSTLETTPVEFESAVYALEDYPVYNQKVGEYCSAIFSGAYSEELYPTLNTLMLNFYHNFNEDAYFFYALEDIDSNGIPELLIGKDFSPEGTPEIIDLYSISNGSIVQYFENPYFGERTHLSILAGGMLQNGGSSSAASGGCSIYQISDDGSSINKIADYTYYFADDNVPPPDGNYMSYEEFEAATSQYQDYSGQIHWVSIDS